ncbi:uncharacterized protein DFL_001009 [Arthrobotrys flagrans]|uniref:Uncharacterized protein n=1 Tax=Arthrobotrys flagrans TaxID=97331 RepID=A0A437AFX9_ARTFL|nr:hypothetical protein DFL_001009 [Arthrobotrys flagrans]
MSKPRVRWGTRPNQPATVKASAHATASPFKVYARASVKLHVGTNMVNVSRNSAFEKQREFEASASSKSEPPVSLDNPQETTLPGATGNPEVASNTLEITSNSGADELAESKKKLVQVAPEDARVLGMDETASQGASFNVGPIDIGSQNDGESLGSTPNAVMNKDSELQTEKKSEPLQAAAENVESAVESNDSGKSSKLSPADLIASLRYYDRRRGTLPDEEPLSPEDVAVLESSRTKLTKGRKSISRSETSSDHSNRKSSFKRIGLAVSSVVVGAYIFGIGTKLLSVQPESTAAAEFLSAVQRSKVTKGPVD